MAILGVALGAAQLGIGLAEKADAKKEAARALGQRRAYQTPEEVYKQLNATEQRAQSGFDPQTLQYLTNETDRTFDASLSTAEQLGADPNNLSAILGSKINSIMQIGAQNHAQNLQNFNQYISALGTLGQSKDAEFFSQQNLVKDAQQKAGVDLANSSQQISAGLNTTLSSVSALAQDNLYKTKDQSQQSLFHTEYGDQGENAYQYAKKNNMNFDQYKKIDSTIPYAALNRF